MVVRATEFDIRECSLRESASEERRSRRTHLRPVMDGESQAAYRRAATALRRVYVRGRI